MERMAGMTGAEAWRGISFEAKVTIVKELVHHLAQLFDNSLTSVGSLILSEEFHYGMDKSVRNKGGDKRNGQLSYMRIVLSPCLDLVVLHNSS